MLAARSCRPSQNIENPRKGIIHDSWLQNRFERIATEESLFGSGGGGGAARSRHGRRAITSDLILVQRIYDAKVDDVQARLLPRLLDLEKERLKDMDANGVDMRLLSLTAPGVQMFDADTATELAEARQRQAGGGDQETSHRRFAGLATCCAPITQARGAEMERAMKKLKLERLHS